MKFNFGTREKEGKTIPSGKFSFRNKEYTLDKNPIKFIIGGLITTSAFMFLFVGLIFVFGVFVSTFSNIIVQIISIILFITVLITILGVTENQGESPAVHGGDESDSADTTHVWYAERMF
jgi:hypothetical protein